MANLTLCDEHIDQTSETDCSRCNEFAEFIHELESATGRHPSNMRDVSLHIERSAPSWDQIQQYR